MNAQHRNTRVCRLVVAISLCVAFTGGVSPAELPPHFAEEDLTAAARFESDRQAARLSARIDEALHRRDDATAVALLQELLDEHAAALIPTGSGYQSGAAAAHARLRTLTSARIIQYERHSGEAARTELTGMLAAGRLDELRELIVRYRYTVAGAEALRTLAFRRFDSGRFAEAAALFEELVRGAREESTPDHAAIVAWCISRLESDGPAAARRIADEYGLTRSPDGASVGGVASGWLADRLTIPVDGASQEPADLLPSDAAAWELPLSPESLSTSLVLDEAGVPAYLPARPLPTRAGLAVRTDQGVMLVDVPSGEVRWRWPADAIPHREEQTNPLPEPLRRSAEFAAFSESVGDHVHRGLSADGRRIYLLEPLPAERTEGNRPRAATNRLASLDLETGRLAWRVAGEDVAGSQREADAGIFFRGPPTVYDDQLLIIGDRADATELFALDAASGALDWSCKLCAVDAGPVRDDRRLAQRCEVLVTGGNAVCPTGGGALVAVDLVSHDVRWAYRYPREPIEDDEIGRRTPIERTRRLLWPDGWRDTFCRGIGDVVVLASGESDRLHGLDAATGGVLWTRPRRDGIYVGCVTESHVVVVHRSRVEGLKLDDGTDSWSASIPEPAGRGFHAGGCYVLPLLRGGTAAVRLADGHVTRTFNPQRPLPDIIFVDADATADRLWRPVSLAWVDGAVIEQSLNGVRRLQALSHTLQEAERLADAAPDDANAAVALADAQHKAGDFAASTQTLASIFERAGAEPPTGSPRRLLDVLFTRSWLSGDPVSELSELTPPLLETDADRIRYHLCLLRESLPDAESAVEQAFALLDLHAENYFLNHADGSGRVRLDRRIHAWLSELVSTSADRQRSRAAAAIERALDERSGDDGAYRRLLRLLDHLPAAQRRLAALDPAWTTAVELAVQQLQLEELAAIGETPIAAQALVSLGQLHEALGDARSAARVYERLAAYESTRLESGETVAAFLESLADKGLGNPAACGPEWPAGPPRITSSARSQASLYFSRPPLLDAGEATRIPIDVEVERMGTQIRFSGSLYGDAWFLDLPPADGFASNMRTSLVYPDLRRAGRLGTIVVLQVGGEVFGVSPFDHQGAPGAQRLWPNADREITSGSRVAAIYDDPLASSSGPQPAVFDERRLLLDRLGHPVGQVGPVRPGCFCVRRSGMLIAYDTVDGAELWRRENLSPAAECHGDDRHVVLIHHGSPRVEVLRALDGALLHSFDRQHGREFPLSVYGCRALMRTPPVSELDAAAEQPGRLSLIDLTNGETIWSRDANDDELDFPVDSQRIGRLTAEGIVRFISLEDGSVVSEHSLQRPQRLTTIRTIVDERSIFLLLSGPMTDAAIQGTVRPDGASPNIGFRRCEVNGPVHAFDVETCEHRWTQSVSNAGISLDQPPDAPVLVFNELRLVGEGAGSDSLQGRVRCLDRRTGAILLDELIETPIRAYALESDVTAGRVDVHLPDRTYRLDFALPAEPE